MLPVLVNKDVYL